MKNSTDPSRHRDRQRQFVEHVEKLLRDDRLRLPTAAGRRPITSLRRDVQRDNHEVELKRLMSDLGVPDRQLQAQMPAASEMTIQLSRTRFLIFRKTVGRMLVLGLAPQRELIQQTPPRPVDQPALQAALAARAAADTNPQVPTTLVVLSTSGFSPDARNWARGSADRNIILAEPGDAGGWTLTASEDLAAVAGLFDPEVDAEKRQRLRDEIARRKADLLGGSLGATRLAAATELPVAWVEDELQSYAKEHSLIAKRLGGQMVLFRQGTVPAAARSGGSDMPFMDRVKAMFARKGDTEKKVALLSERRAELSVQRDRAYEEMGALEQKEAEMRQQFRDTTSSITRRRITSQLVQLRKDLDRRQQLLGMLNQQINVVATHLHNLELVQQGQVAQLPDSEELAADAAAAEEVLAELQASNEVAATVSAVGPSGLSDEEQALYEELEREAAQPQPEPQSTPARIPPRAEPRAAQPPPIPTRKEPQRNEPEPG
jgi:hypothetical protein